MLVAVAGALALSLAVSALHDTSQAFDVWYYHLPFAARIVGLLDAHAYVFSSDNQARFDGFPLFGELLQGFFWRVTGHVQAANLVSLFALFALPLYLWRRSGVRPHLAFLALLAIPLVQIHATSSYVDLPGNVFATILILEVLRAFVANAAPSPRSVAFAAMLAAATVNTKFQLVPIVVVAALALVVLSIRDLVRARSHGASVKTARRRLVLIALAIPLVFATPLKNAIVHGNPVWPIELRIAGRTLPYAERAYGSSPRHLERSAAPVRFVRSVLEVDNRPVASHARWSLDQWSPPEEPGYRMGGFFGGYMLLHLVAFGVLVWRTRSRETFVAATVFGVATVVAALVPQSHELRYYMFWALLLVSLNVVFWTREASSLVGIVATAAIAIVAWSTEGAYLYPSGMTFRELLDARVDRSIVDGASEGGTLCIAKPPFDLLYASRFHGRPYTVVEADDDGRCPP